MGNNELVRRLENIERETRGIRDEITSQKYEPKNIGIVGFGNVGQRIVRKLTEDENSPIVAKGPCKPIQRHAYYKGKYLNQVG